MNQEDYKSYTQSLALYQLGKIVTNPSAYYVNMSAYGSRRGFELMSAEDAEYKSEETKWSSFAEFEDTIVAYPINF